MIGLVRSEWTKLVTTRVWIGLLLGGCVLVGGITALLVGLAGAQGNYGQQGLPPVGDPAFQRMALGQVTQATVLVLILGIIGMTQEYRHRTATPTFLTTPRRGRVVLAKLIAYLLAAIPYAVVMAAVNLLVLETYARARGAAPSLTGDNLHVLLYGGLALVIYAVIGVGLGALLRNQVGAIVGALVYLFVVETVIAAIPATAPTYEWLPGGALRAMTSTVVTGSDVSLLQPWQGALLLLGYGLVAAVLGALLTVRRDIT
jgi:ABC-type transport system involved in multi-copper enzyme maturation permease subunit